MPLAVTFTYRNDNPDTIWNKLAARLGRQPTHQEAVAEVRRILFDEAPPTPQSASGARNEGA